VTEGAAHDPQMGTRCMSRFVREKFQNEEA
jgi:hypothetical protein